MKLTTGSGFSYTQDTQTGSPVNGAASTDASPFTIRLLPPDVLLEAAGVSLATVASQGAAVSTELRRSLQTVSPVATPPGQLQAFVSEGRFYTAAQPAFVSALADAYTAADIAIQLQQILDTPPLVLLVNPTEMNITYTKIQSYQSKTRYGYIFEAWGEEQPSISFSCTTGGWVAGAADPTNPYGAQVSGTTSSPSGYQYASRPFSSAGQQFNNLLQIYKNNGYIYDTIGKSYAHLFVGSVVIDYDQWTYLGHIDSFNFTIDEGSPGRISSFDMEFKVTRMYDTATGGRSLSPLHPVSQPSATQNLTGSTVLDSGSETGYAQPPVDLFR